MLKNYLIILLFLVLLSCNEKQDTSSYRNVVIKGVIEERIGEELIKFRGQEVDSITNIILSKGKYFQNLKTEKVFRTGWHSFYNREGVIVSREEYFFGQNDNNYEESLSQYILFNSNGDTIKAESSYLKLFSNRQNLIKIGDTLKIKINIFHH